MIVLLTPRDAEESRAGGAPGRFTPEHAWPRAGLLRGQDTRTAESVDRIDRTHLIPDSVESVERSCGSVSTNFPVNFGCFRRPVGTSHHHGNRPDEATDRPGDRLRELRSW